MPKLHPTLSVLMMLGLADAAVALASPWLATLAGLGFNTAVGLLVTALIALAVLIVIGFKRLGRRAAWLFVYLPLVLLWPLGVTVGLWMCTRSHCKLY